MIGWLSYLHIQIKTAQSNTQENHLSIWVVTCQYDLQLLVMSTGTTCEPEIPLFVCWKLWIGDIWKQLEGGTLGTESVTKPHNTIGWPKGQQLWVDDCQSSQFSLHHGLSIFWLRCVMAKQNALQCKHNNHHTTGGPDKHTRDSLLSPSSRRDS